MRVRSWLRMNAGGVLNTCKSNERLRTYILTTGSKLVEAFGPKEKYSRGRRGAPAKGVGRATGARVQIPPSPFFSKCTR